MKKFMKLQSFVEGEIIPADAEFLESYEDYSLRKRKLFMFKVPTEIPADLEGQLERLKN